MTCLSPTVDSSSPGIAIPNQWPLGKKRTPDDKLAPKYALLSPQHRGAESWGARCGKSKSIGFSSLCDSWVFSDYFSTRAVNKGKWYFVVLVFFWRYLFFFSALFFFKANYQLDHVNGNNNQGGARHVLIHLFAFSPPLAPQVGLIGQIDGARANWAKVINI